MEIWVIIAIGIAIFILYWLYTMLVDVSLLKGVVSLNAANTKEKKYFDEMSDKLFYDGWLYISTANTSGSATTKNVFIKREIMIGMEGTDFKVYKIDDGGSSYTAVLSATTNFPLNKWVYFAVRYSDKVLEIYLNGKLVKTKFISGETGLINSSYKKNQDLTVGSTTNNVKGFITKLRRLTDPPDSNYIWQHYLEGNGQLYSMLGVFGNWNTYTAKVSVSDDKTKIRELKILGE